MPWQPCKLLLAQLQPGRNTQSGLTCAACHLLPSTPQAKVLPATSTTIMPLSRLLMLSLALAPPPLILLSTSVNWQPSWAKLATRLQEGGQLHLEDPMPGGCASSQRVSKFDCLHIGLVPCPWLLLGLSLEMGTCWARWSVASTRYCAAQCIAGLSAHHVSLLMMYKLYYI